MAELSGRETSCYDAQLSIATDDLEHFLSVMPKN